ncbi:hypothetical protein TH53_00375 [Pedobacter lusitanus]|uniref:Uncharacterized protein n=1 Tax=Pedobacter lusitanus TaxID=1503925 RepID=A0A0D0GX14_9SPHI|nr:hypothetical protein TH53_00375 [Pedobacter lusitanus]
MTSLQNINAPFDFTYLHSFSRDNDFLIEIIDLCLINTPLYMESLNSSFAKKELERVIFFLYRIKSTTSVMGRNDISIYICGIEKKNLGGTIISCRSGI